MSHAPPPPGTLYVVSTPIGNLEDITLRALRILRASQVVAAEDTRRTARLLAHFEIPTPTLSLHEHNERTRTPQLLDRLRSGHHVSLVTDAGTPLLSDPGLLLVRAAIDAGLRVEPIPGASALLSALVTSGISTSEFAFLGFPPNRSNARKGWYERADALGIPFVVFEAPHRLTASLKDAREVLGPRPMAAARELTKLHEEHVRGTVSEVLAHFDAVSPRGELTLVFAAADNRETAASEAPGDHLSDQGVWSEFCLLTKCGMPRRAAITELSRRLHRPSREIYASAERGKTLEEAEAKGHHHE